MRYALRIVGPMVLSCLLSIASLAQIAAFTSDGRKVILSMDGTWKFVFEENGKKVILNPDGTWKYETVKDSSVKKPAQIVSDSIRIVKVDSVKVVPVKPPVKKAPPNLDCSALVGIEKDITGDSWFGESRKIIVSEDMKTGFSILILNTRKGPVTWETTLIGGSQCINEDNKMIIVFKDGTRLQLVNDGKSNCDSKFTLYFTGVYGKETTLDALKKTMLSSMRVYTTKGFVDANFAEDDALRFRAALNCLVK